MELPDRASGDTKIFDGEEYLSLQFAARHTPYSSDYLRLLARGNHLKARKLGRNWYVTRTAIAEYVSTHAQPEGLIPLEAAAQGTPYSAEYLSLLARRGRLSAYKIGRNWHTTPTAIEEYIGRQQRSSFERREPEIVPMPVVATVAIPAPTPVPVPPSAPAPSYPPLLPPVQAPRRSSGMRTALFAGIAIVALLIVAGFFGELKKIQQIVQNIAHAPQETELAINTASPTPIPASPQPRDTLQSIVQQIVIREIPLLVPGLKGEKGDKGDKGDTGAPGAPGTPGTNGIQGPAGFQIGSVLPTATNPNSAGTIGGITYFSSQDLHTQTLTVSDLSTLSSLIAGPTSLGRTSITSLVVSGGGTFSSDLNVSGTASVSKLLVDGVAITGSTGTFTGMDFGTIDGTQVKVSSLSFDAGAFDLATVASAGTVKLDWLNGPASRSAAQTISGAWTFTAASNQFSNTLEANVASLSMLTVHGQSTFSTASASAIELTGYASASSFIGALTGHASLDLPLTGGTLTGNLIGTGASFSAGEFSTYASASRFYGPLTGNVTGNASTATELAANPTDCSVGSGFADAIDAFGNLTCSLTSGNYALTLTASLSSWNTFFHTPSTQITAGNAIDWSGNTLNFGGNLTENTVIASAGFTMDFGSTHILGPADLNQFTTARQYVSKDYVDTSVAGLHFSYFMTNTASATAGYDLLSTAQSSPDQTVTTSGLGAGNNQLLESFITTSPPPFVTLKAGTYEGHVHAEKTTGNRVVILYWTLSKRAVGGAETLIMTSESSGDVTTIDEFTLHANLVSNFTLAATDRLVMKWYANVSGNPLDATVVLHMQGTTESGIALPISTDILNSVYVRQDGTKPLTGNWDAGAFNITNIGHLAAVTASLSAGEFTSYASASAIYGSGLTSCSGSNVLQYNAITGLFSCVSSSGGVRTESSEGTITAAATALNFDAGQFSLMASGTTETNLHLNWTSGPASRSTQNTWSALNIFSNGASVSTNFEVTGYASASSFIGSLAGHASLDLPLTGGTLTGNLIGTSASLSANLEVVGYSSISNALFASDGNIGIGTSTPTTKLEVVGTASVSQMVVRGLLDIVGVTSTTGLRIDNEATATGKYLSMTMNGAATALIDVPGGSSAGLYLSTNSGNQNVQIVRGFSLAKGTATAGETGMAWVTALTPDAAELFTGTTANSLHINETGDIAFDFNNGPCGTSACTNPTLIVHSANQATNEWISLYHNQSNGVIDVGKGSIVLADPASVSGNFEVVGTASVSKLLVDLAGTQTTFAVCHPVDGQTTSQELVDCNTPVGDYMELYPMDRAVQEGDIVMASDRSVAPMIGSQSVPVLMPATERNRMLGIVSVAAQAGDFNSIGHNIAAADNPLPLALMGRVRVRVSMENGPILPGDRITLSAVPGVGTKATTAGPVVGIALEPAHADGLVLVFATSQYWSPSGGSGSALASGSADSVFVANQDAWNWMSIMDRIKYWFFTFWNITIDNGLIKTVKGMFTTVDLQTGATIHDGANGKPYCVSVMNGQLITTPGECGTGSTEYPTPSASASPAPSATPENSPSPASSSLEFSPTPLPTENPASASASLSPTPSPEATPTPIISVAPTPTEISSQSAEF